VSFAEPEVNVAWVEEQAFPYEVWTDVDRTLSLHYGAAEAKDDIAPKRVTKVLDAEGVLVLEYLEVDVGAHPKEVLDDCTLLFGP
jgi:peroxiredoxin